MVKIGSANPTRLVLALLVLLTTTSVAFATSVADAGPLAGPSGPVNEVTAPVEEAAAPIQQVTETVTAPVREAAETVAPPVAEVTETVTAPIHEATETVAAPVHEAAEKVTTPANEVSEVVSRPVKEATEAVRPPVKQVTETASSSPAAAAVRATAGTAVHGVANTTGSSSGGAAARSAGTAVREAAATATHSAGTIGGTATSFARTDQPSTGADGGASKGTIASRGGPQSAAVPDLGPGQDTFQVRSIDGSVRAPLRRWMAYVWPAIALTRQAMAHLLEGPGRGDLLAALYSMAGQERAIGDYGVSAASSVGGPGHSSGSSFLSKIPPAIAHAFTTDPPLPTVLFDLVVVLAIAGVVVALLWDIGLLDDFLGRRRRRWR